MPPFPVVVGVALVGGMACWFYSLDPVFWKTQIKSWFKRA